MSERNKEQTYIEGPLHLVRCAIELGQMAIRELVMQVDEAQDCFGEDSPEDQAVRSGRWA